MAMAVEDKVTVSIAADTRGVFMWRFLENLVEMSVSEGSISE
jgi:hypothetical protein